MATAAILTETLVSVLPRDQQCQTPNRRLNRSILSQDGVETPPDLTPSSEVSELDIKSPATPRTPTKSFFSSRFLDTCVPLKLERRILQAGEDLKEEKKPLWDVSFGDTSTKAWLFKQCSDLGTWTLPDSAAISVDVNFSGCSYEKVITQFTTPSSAIAATVLASTCAPRLEVRAKSVDKPSRPAAKPHSSKDDSYLKEQFIRALPTDVVTRLINDPNACVAQTKQKPFRRCTKKIPQSSAQPDSILEDFKERVEAQDLEKCLVLVDQLIKKLFCNGAQHLRIAREALASIKACLAEAAAAEAPAVKALVLDWLKDVSEDRPVVSEPAKPRSSTNSCLQQDFVKPQLRRSNRIAAKAESSAHASADQTTQTVGITYVPYYENVAKNSSLTPSQLISQTLDRPLKMKDLNDGYLYVFWRQGDFGLVKIGYTTESRGVRLDDWRKKCGGDNQGCGDMQDKSLDVRVRNVRRLESLVHAELKQYRRIQMGCRCGTNWHIEWFAVDLALVHKVIEKWTSWLDEQRYEDKIGGALLPLTEKQREDLCKLVELPKRQVDPPATQRRRSSRLRMKREQAEASFGVNAWSGLGPANFKVEEAASEHDAVPE